MASSKLYYFFVFVIPFLGISLLIPIPATAFFVAVFAFQLSLSLVKPQNEMVNYFFLITLSLFIWLILSHAINFVRFEYSIGELRLFFGRLSFIVIALMTYSTIRTEEDFRKILRVLSYSVLLLSGLIILFSIFHIDPFHVMTRHPRIYWGVSMPFHKTSAIPVSYGEVGIIAISVIPALMYSVRRQVGVFGSSVSVAALMLILLAIFVSQSRNAWVSVLVSMSSVLLLRREKPPGQLVRAALFLFLGATGAVSLFYFKDLFEDLIRGFVSTDIYQANVLNRLYSYEMGVQLFLNNMTMGIGSANVAKNIGLFKGEENVLHNAFIDQLAGTGLFGFIPFVLLFAIAFFQLARISKSKNQRIAVYGRILMCSLIGTVCALQFYRGFLPETLAVEYGLILSLWRLHAFDAPGERL